MEFGWLRGCYAAGGARGVVCEKTGRVAGMASSGSGREATSKSTATHWAISGCAAVWWPSWQYGHWASLAESGLCQWLTAAVANTSRATSASETPSMRIIFRTFIPVNLGPDTTAALYANVM